MPFLNANTPEDLRDAVFQAVAEEPALAAEVDLSTQAHLEAIRYARSHSNSGNRWLTEAREDSPRIADIVDAVARHWRMENLEDVEPGRAVLILGYDPIALLKDERYWAYVSDLKGESLIHVGDQSPCHSCSLVSIAETGWINHVDRPVEIAAVVHRAVGPYVVEIALCHGCLSMLELIYQQDCERPSEGA